MIAKILTQRGLENKEKAAKFLYASVDDFYDPFHLYGMERAVSRIHRALEKNEKIWIYGDYDADGVTGTSVLLETFKMLGREVEFYIPNRFTEGYGLHAEAIQLAVDKGVSLLITVDTGISAVEETQVARSLGMDVIITDHHEPPSVLPDALAVINPKQPACEYPDPMLAGAGVAFKLAQALLGRVPEELLPLAALGTIADLVPLVDENRIIAALGLKKINEKQHIGINALLEVAGLSEREITAGHIGFSLGPRLNAGGRLSTAVPAVQLLTSRRGADALALARQLDELNQERQQLVDELTAEAVAHVEANEGDHRYAIVIAQPNWNTGVLGIVASRLVERFYRPAVVLGIDESTGEAKGSGRSIEGFDMFKALSALNDLFTHFGGHKMAAGVTMAATDVDTFSERLNALASEWLTADDFKPMTSIEMTCSIDEISIDWIEQLAMLGPFGVGNATPRFHVTGAQLEKFRRIGRDRNHLKLSLSSGKNKLEAIGFGWGEMADELTAGANLETVGELQVNEWNGNRSAQLLVTDAAVPHLQVFDWRGRHMTDDMWQRLEAQHTSFVCFDQKNVSRIPNHLQKGEQLIAGWKDIRSDMIQNERCFHIALVDFPTDVGKYHELLRSFSQLERVYILGEVEEDAYVVPKRDDFKKVYALLHHCRSLHDWTELARRSGLSVTLVGFILEVFLELGFIDRSADGVRLRPNPEKRSLEESTVLQKRQKIHDIYQTFYYATPRELADEITKVRTAEPAH